MPVNQYVLTDAASGIRLDDFALEPDASLRLEGSEKWAITRTTLRGGVSEGVDVVTLNNGELSVDILPTRGMGLWRGSYRGLTLGWSSPVKLPVNPCYVNLTERSGLGWLSGFNELMCRCGLSWHGEPGVDVIQDNTGNRIETPLTLHGKIANTPAHRVIAEVIDDDAGSLRITGTVDEAMLFGPALRLTSTVETRAGSNSITVSDEITNLGGQPAEIEVLYHTNLGAPFLEEGAQFEAPVAEMAPANGRAAEGLTTWQIYEKPTAGYVEQCYLMELRGDENRESVAILRNHAADRGFSLSFSLDQLPYFTIWKNTQAEADGYVTGMEPGTSFPNLKSYERKHRRLIVIEPGQSHHTRITMTVHDTAESVAEVENRIRAIRGDSVAKIHEKPIAKYSAAGDE